MGPVQSYLHFEFLSPLLVPILALNCYLLCGCAVRLWFYLVRIYHYGYLWINYYGYHYGYLWISGIISMDILKWCYPRKSQYEVTKLRLSLSY